MLQNLFDVLHARVRVHSTILPDLPLLEHRTPLAPTGLRDGAER